MPVDNTFLNELLRQAAPVMPVLKIDRIEHALPLAEALRNGGLSVLEVTLRTPVAYDAIRAMQQVDGVVVGAGTVTQADQLRKLQDLGAAFAVSPGITSTLLAAAVVSPVPLLPGICTVSELMFGMEHGYSCFKFFPAASSGGVAALRAFAGPFPQLSFCPTGGITAANFKDYLALSNVRCVGGSWIALPALCEAGDWRGIEQLAREVCTAAE